MDADMSEYTTPSGLASIETEGGILSEINYRYPATGKDKTIQELLRECLKRQAKVDELTAALLTVTLELESWNLTQGDPEALKAIAIGHAAIRNTRRAGGE